MAVILTDVALLRFYSAYFWNLPLPRTTLPSAACGAYPVPSTHTRSPTPTPNPGTCSCFSSTSSSSS